MNVILLLALLSLGQANDVKASLTPEDYLNAAIRVRKQITSYDLRADVRFVRTDHKTKVVTRQHTRYRIVARDSSQRVDYELLNFTTGEVVERYTICLGCTPDKKIYFRDPTHNNAMVYQSDSSHQFLLNEPRLAGYETTPFVGLERNRQFQLLLNPHYLPPTLEAIEANGVINLKRIQKGTNGTLAIQIDPRLGNNITRLEFLGNDEAKTRMVSQSRYDQPSRGLYFPVRVESEWKTPEMDMNEVIDFHSVTLNKTPDPSLFTPKSIDLRYNSYVVELVGKKGGLRFYDGEKLVDAPPDPSEYYPGNPDEFSGKARQRSNRVWYWSGALLFAAITTGVFYFARKNRERK